jgi:hypothetical protein
VPSAADFNNANEGRHLRRNMDDAVQYKIYRAPEQLAELNELKSRRYAQFQNGITYRHPHLNARDQDRQDFLRSGKDVIGLQKRLQPENLPVAGQKNWFYEQRASGPLNGAMEHVTNVGALQSVTNHDKLDVQDINGFARQAPPYTKHAVPATVEADWNQHMVYRQPRSPKRFESAVRPVERVTNSLDPPSSRSRVRVSEPSERDGSESSPEMKAFTPRPHHNIAVPQSQAAAPLKQQLSQPQWTPMNAGGRRQLGAKKASAQMTPHPSRNHQHHSLHSQDSDMSLQVANKPLPPLRGRDMSRDAVDTPPYLPKVVPKYESVHKKYDVPVTTRRMRSIMGDFSL